METFQFLTTEDPSNVLQQRGFITSLTALTYSRGDPSISWSNNNNNNNNPICKAPECQKTSVAR